MRKTVLRTPLRHGLWQSALALLLLLPGAASAADVATDVAFGPPPMPGYLGRLLQPVKAGDPLLPGSFDLKAQLGLKHVPAMELDSSVPLEASPSAGRPAGAERGVRLTPPPDTDLSAYDELWVDHAAPGHCTPQLELQTNEGLQEGRLSSTTIVGMAEGRGVLFTEQPYRMPWVGKDMFYLLARQLGSRDDRQWRYAQDGDATVLQRRLQVPLDRAQVIELEFPSGARLNGVNLLISVGDHHRPSRLLTPADFTSETQDDGVRTRVRLRVDRVLAEYRQSKRPVSLAEVLVFYQGTKERALSDKPLRRLTLLSLPGAGLVAAGDRTLQAPMKTEQLTANTWRTSLDLKDVTGRWVARMPLRMAEWQITGGAACRVELLGAHLVKLKRSSSPAFVNYMAAHVRALGGPFLVRPEDRTGIEWLDIAAQLPLAWAQPLPQSPRVRGSDAEYPGWGLRVASTGGNVLDGAQGEGLAFSGGAAVSMDWRVDFRVQPGQRLHVDVRSEDHRQPEIDVRVMAEGGRQYDFRVPPNQPVLLDRRIPEGVRVRSIALRLDAQGLGTPWSVRGVTVFRPYRMEAAQVGNAYRPGWGVIPLVVQPEEADPGDTWRSDGMQAVGALHSRQGAPGGTVLRWTTPVQLPARHVLDLRLRYEIQGAEIDPCWLRAEIRGDRGHRLERQLCSRDGDIREGVTADLLEHFDEDEQIVAIHWKGALYVEQPAQVNLQASIGVGARPSVNETLSRGPVLLMGGERWLPGTLTADVRKTLAQGRRPVWLDYGRLTIAPKQDMAPALLQDDDLFELKRVTLVSDQDAQSAAVVQWREQLRPPAPSPGMGKLQKLGVALLAGLGVWLVWRGLAWRWRAVLRLVQPLRDRSRQLAAKAWALCEHLSAAASRHMPLFHFAVMVAALPLFWRAGRGDEGAPWLLGAGVSLWITSALHLWRELPAWGRFFVQYLWPCMWIAWVAWALGAYEAPSTLAAAAATAAGTLWPVASAVHRSLWWMRRGMGLLVGGVLCLAAICYGLGFMSTVDWGENVFITLGGLCMIAAWWCAVRSAREGLTRWRPGLARWLYGERGGPFLVGAMLALVASMVLLQLGMSQLAAHVVTLCFYQLCLGVALQAWVHARRGPP
ncbi:hypothetical protein [Acidovorax sp. NCPPB 4044]|uniref:hypothetical protein n=1 Tax=Acidovorax sp. NCPPB 4044 TaxID=2940490 RepID=UPI0023037AE0|nr:hypothetical protein [Acidovorax sp. NCPPB 4044]MDA8519456.1 hypothetical protein [Acidovorax sp. NCPPB 4044]